MVSIKKKIIDEKAYYYIEHSYRKNGQVHKKEKYIGTKIPKNIEKLKEDLLLELYQEIWFKKFNIMKDNFSKRKKNMPKSIEEKNLEYFAIIFTYTTNKIEGSTTYRETALLLEKGITPANRSIEDIKEAEQHREVFYDMLNHDKKISMSTLLYWHKKIFQYTKKNKAGKIREYPVRISGSKHIPPTPIELDLLIREFFNWYNQNKNKIHPVQLAALAHFKFVSIHPFGDGNGRISRLLMNYVLNKNGYPMLIIDTLWFFRRYLKENKEFLE